MSNNSLKGQPAGISPEREITIGKVVSVNVPRRELRIAPTTSHPERFNELQKLKLKTRDDQMISFPVVRVRITPRNVIVKISSDEDCRVASSRGAVAVVSWSERFRLPENEYYIDDLLGLIVKDSEGRIVGRLTEVWQTPANDIYQVLDGEGREILLPATEEVILKVDIERHELVADISQLK